MKKIIFLLVPLLLTACNKPTEETIPTIDQPIPIENKILETTLEPANPPKEAPKTISKKPETIKKEPDPKTDEMAEELDSLIDDMISGL
jgi:hypothetical protein